MTCKVGVVRLKPPKVGVIFNRASTQELVLLK